MRSGHGLQPKSPGRKPLAQTLLWHPRVAQPQPGSPAALFHLWLAPAARIQPLDVAWEGRALKGVEAFTCDLSDAHGAVLEPSLMPCWGCRRRCEAVTHGQALITLNYPDPSTWVQIWGRCIPLVHRNRETWHGHDVAALLGKAIWFGFPWDGCSTSLITFSWAKWSGLMIRFVIKQSNEQQ